MAKILNVTDQNIEVPVESAPNGFWLFQPGIARHVGNDVIDACAGVEGLQVELDPEPIAAEAAVPEPEAAVEPEPEAEVAPEPSE